MSRPFSTFGRRDGLLLLRPYCASSTIYTCHLWWSCLDTQCWKNNEKVSLYYSTKRAKRFIYFQMKRQGHFHFIHLAKIQIFDEIAVERRHFRSFSNTVLAIFSRLKVGRIFFCCCCYFSFRPECCRILKDQEAKLLTKKSLDPTECE